MKSLHQNWKTATCAFALTIALPSTTLAQNAEEMWESLQNTLGQIHLVLEAEESRAQGAGHVYTNVSLSHSDPDFEGLAIRFPAITVTGNVMNLPAEYTLIDEYGGGEADTLATVQTLNNTITHSIANDGADVWTFNAERLDVTGTQHDEFTTKASWQNLNADIRATATLLSMTYQHQSMNAEMNGRPDRSREETKSVNIGPMNVRLHMENVTFDENFLDSIDNGGQAGLEYRYDHLQSQFQDSFTQTMSQSQNVEGTVILTRNGLQAEMQNGQAEFEVHTDGTRVSGELDALTLNLTLPLMASNNTQNFFFSQKIDGLTLNGTEGVLKQEGVDNAAQIARLLEGPWNLDVNLDAQLRLDESFHTTQNAEATTRLERFSTSNTLNSPTTELGISFEASAQYDSPVAFQDMDNISPATGSGELAFTNLQALLDTLPQDVAVMVGMMAMTFGERDGNTIRYTFEVINEQLTINGQRLPF